MSYETKLLACSTQVFTDEIHKHLGEGWEMYGVPYFIEKPVAKNETMTVCHLLLRRSLDFKRCAFDNPLHHIDSSMPYYFNYDVKFADFTVTDKSVPNTSREDSRIIQKMVDREGAVWVNTLGYAMTIKKLSCGNTGLFFSRIINTQK